MAMAPNLLSEPTSQRPSQPRADLRNPLPLSASQEAQVRDIYYRNVRAKCAAETKAFALCARGRTISLAWACNAEQFAMNSCMMAHASREEEDKARIEWFQGVQERRLQKEKELELVEIRRTEVIEMTRKQEAKELQEETERKRIEGQKEPKKGWW